MDTEFENRYEVDLFWKGIPFFFHLLFFRRRSQKEKILEYILGNPLSLFTEYIFQFFFLFLWLPSEETQVKKKNSFSR